MKQNGILLPAITAALTSAGLISYANQIEVAEALLVDVNATQMAAGALTSITNAGTLGGYFEARGPGDTIPTIAQAGGTLGINLDGNDYMQLVQELGGAFTEAPVGIRGVDPTRSIEVWAFNPVQPPMAGEETMVAWGRRGADGQNLSFGYGTHGSWGAAAHWGGQDIGWNNAGGAPQQGRWHHLVYTFSGTNDHTTRLYADGSLTNSEALAPGAINTALSGIAIGTQFNGDGTINGDPIRGSLLIARLRIHDGVLTPAQIQHNYEMERAAMIDPVPPAPEALTGPPTHRYSFNVAATNDAQGIVIPDLIGFADATVRGSGATLTGSRVTLPGGPSSSAAYVNLQNNLLSENSTNNFGTGEVTLEGWVKVTASRAWSRILDFGVSAGLVDIEGPGGGGEGLDYIFLSAQVGSSTGMRRVEVRDEEPRGGGANAMDVMSPTFNTDVHFVLTWHEATGEIRYYENGRLEGVLITDEPMSDVMDLNVWLGRSNWAGDQNMQGEFDEFRIYDRVLTAAEAAGNFQAGPNTLNTGDLPANIVNDPASLTVQESFTANFTVGVEGSPPLSFQWLRDGQAISNATNISFSLSASPEDSGAGFSVVVSNFTGGQPQVVTSAVATLTVQTQAVALAHRYDFSPTETANEVRDLVGTAHGEVRGDAAFVDGQLILDGTNDYVNLPNGLLTNFNSITIEMWVQNEGSAGWARLFDFGNSAAGEDFTPGTNVAAGTQYMFLAAPSGLGNLRGSLTTNGGGAAEQVIEWSGQSIPNNQLTHIAFVVNDPANAGRLFVNGALVGENPGVTLTPAMLGVTSNNWLGRAQFNDPFWKGRFEEFRIYEGAMTPQQVQASFQAGIDIGGTRPQLTISRSPNGQSVIIAWPETAAGFDLEARDSYNPGSAWGPVSATPTVENGMFRVEIPITGESRFFRLAQ